MPRTATAAACTADAMPPLLAAVPPARLQAMRDAGEEVAAMQAIASKTGDNLVGEVLREADGFLEWAHYPDGDVYDPASHGQYYYHAHPAEERFDGEHGHFHLFVRGPAIPDTCRPLQGQDLPGRDDLMTHLVAIAMDAYGLPIRLFTTNRWVTGDTWFAAADAVRLLDLFRIDTIRPNLAVNRWITAMVRFYAPQIAALLVERDEAVALWKASHPDSDAFEDRRLAITSSIRISVEDDLAALRAR